MTEDKLLYLGIDVLVLLLVQLQLMATLSRSIFMIMDLNSVALSGVKAGSPRATEQQSCTGAIPCPHPENSCRGKIMTGPGMTAPGVSMTVFF